MFAELTVLDVYALPQAAIWPQVSGGYRAKVASIR